MKNWKLFAIALPLTLLFASPAMAVSFNGGITAGNIKKNAARTQNFQIEFSDIIKAQTDSDGDGFPNIVEIIAEAAEDSYEVIVEDLNYPEPNEGERTTIILDDKDEFLIPGSIGTTGVFSNQNIYVAINPWLNSNFLEVTTAHEFFHVIQFNYHLNFASVLQGVNLAESTAVWIEDKLFDDVNDYVSYLPDFFNHVDYSVFANAVPNNTLFTYALNVWTRFLGEYYDDDIVQEIWEEYSGSNISFTDDLKIYEALHEVVDDRGDDLGEVFQDFTIWNLEADESYEEGDLFPDVTFIDGTLTEEYVLSDDSAAPASYGANYLYFENPGEDDFHFHIQKSDVIRMAVSLVPVKNGNADLADIESVIIDQNERLESELTLEDLNDHDVVVVLSPLESDFDNPGVNFDIGYIYTYIAKFGDTVSVDATDIGGNSVDEKEGSTEPIFEEGRDDESLRLSITNYDSNTVFLSWNRPNNDDIYSYVLNYGTEPGEYEFTKGIEKPYTTFATIDGLEEGTRYYFQVTALDSRGRDEGDPSPEISVIPADWIFTDLSYTDVHFDSISSLVDVGIFQGYPDNSFKPNQSINRAELLKILIEGQGFTPDAGRYKNCFPDVGSEWYARYVCYAKDQGWVKGYPDNTFRPANTVNKVEALKMLFEVYAAGLNEGQTTARLPYPDLDNRAWYAVYVEEASALGILSERINNDFLPTVGRNRGDMAEVLYRYLVVLDFI